MADDNNPNPGGLTPGMTPDGSTVGPQPTPPGTDVNESPPKDPVVDTGPKAGPNSEGKVPQEGDGNSTPPAPAEGVQTTDDLK